MNGYEGGIYNVLVTTYNPDDFRRYINDLRNRVVYDKTKDAPQRGSGSMLPSHLNGAPFADMLSQKPPIVKVEKAGVSFDAETESASPGKMSLKTWNQSNYVRAKDEAALIAPYTSPSFLLSYYRRISGSCCRFR